MNAEERCEPCDDGRRLLIAAAVARLGWGLATHRLAAEGAAEGVAFSAWAAFGATCAAPVLAYRLALGARLSRAAALAAGVLVAVHPALVDAGTRATAAAALPLLAAAALTAWVSAWNSGSLLAAAAAGLFAGGTVYAEAWPGFAALLIVVAAAARRAEQASWKALLAVALIFGAIAAGPRLVEGVRTPLKNKWSTSVAVSPAEGGAQTRTARNLFAGLLWIAGFFGLALIARAPGGLFVVAWLAGMWLSRRWPGIDGRISEDPAMAVLAAAGLASLGFIGTD